MARLEAAAKHLGHGSGAHGVSGQEAKRPPTGPRRAPEIVSADNQDALTLAPPDAGGKRESPRTARELAEALGGVRRAGDGCLARCPAHEDRKPSLSIKDKPGGGVLVRCHAGCSQGEVVSALKERGLWPDARAGKERATRKRARRGEGAGIPPRKGSRLQESPPGCTLSAYAEAKQLPVAFLRELGLSEIRMYGAPAVRIPYRDEAGEEAAIRFRTALAGADRFRWKAGSKPRLYGLWRLAEARTAGEVALVEGESDAHTLWRHGVPALGLPGAGNWREDRDAPAFEGIATIYVVLEPDKGGEAMLAWIARSAIRERARLVRLPAKDASELHLADPAAFGGRLREAFAAAIPWTERERAEREARAAEDRRLCADLARAPRILDRFAEDLATRGVAGEERLARLLFLALVSRLLERPVSVAVKGPSSGGKSFLVQSVLDFFPPEAYYTLTAMSERALAYSQEPIAHRFLVLYEAAGLAGEFASYLMRSLLSEGRLAYETVEKTSEGLRAAKVEREGPTGLLVTTTRASLHPENETRLLSLTISDTAEQTLAVMAAAAREAEGREAEEARKPPDLEPWRALQRLLAAGEAPVIAPFASALAGLTPPVAVRLRRDFGALLTLVRAHALLHRDSRARDAKGRIVATLEDYAVVRDLTADLFAEGVSRAVSAADRETVRTVEALTVEHSGGVPVYAVARRLRLDDAAASRRLHKCAGKGWLRNEEERRGRPARWTLGDPLPEDRELLPSPEALAGSCGLDAPTGGVQAPLPLGEEGDPAEAEERAAIRAFGGG